MSIAPGPTPPKQFCPHQVILLNHFRVIVGFLSRWDLASRTNEATIPISITHKSSWNPTNCGTENPEASQCDWPKSLIALAFYEIIAFTFKNLTAVSEDSHAAVLPSSGLSNHNPDNLAYSVARS
jgi:hypothetical protein